jgi:hypothetical protein
MNPHVWQDPDAVPSKCPPEVGWISILEMQTGIVKGIYMSLGGACSDIGTAFAFLRSITKPVSDQILMNAERPKFQGTAENYAEFKRG